MSFVLSMWSKMVCHSVKQTARVLGATIVLSLISLPLFSQANQGTIQGTVFDQTGGAIAGATVTVLDVARGVSRPLITDSAGLYVAPNLTPGTYTVRGEAKGFQTVEHTDILLEVGQNVRVDLVLRPGEQTQTVTVTEEIPAIDTTDVTLGGTLEQQAIAALPLNGRDFKNILNLRPGVTAYVGGGESSWSANGIRPEDVGYLVDGVRTDENYNGNSAINSSLRSGNNPASLPIDAIDEFNTEENPKAEVGWKPGAIINIGLKSGTNTLHGTAFALGRETGMDARNFFDPATNASGIPNAKQPVALEQFGGSAGGFIRKDKLFWFADYEGQYYTVGNINPTTTPATVSLASGTLPNGDPTQSLVDACIALVKAATPITPLSSLIAGFGATPPTTIGGCKVAPTNYTPGPSESLFPTNLGNNPLGPSLVNLNLGNTAQQNNGVGKVDYHVNDKHSINGMYYAGLGGIIDPQNFIGIAGTSNSPFNNDDSAKAQVALGAWTWSLSSARVNEFRVGYDRLTQVWGSSDHAVNPLAYGVNTGVTNPKLFGFPGVGIPAAGYLGFGSGLVRNLTTDSLQLVDHFSVVRGNHSFKFGGEFIHNDVQNFITSRGKGTISFSSIEDFLQGNSNTSAIFAGDPTRDLSNNQYALFVQDDWRVTRKVIVNLGVRWEYDSVPTEAHNKLGNFDPTLGLVQVGKQIKSLFTGDFNNFSPRLGVAWDMRGNGRTVLRAGGSVMYSYLPFKIWGPGPSQSSGPATVPTGAKIITLQTGPAGQPGDPNGITAINVTSGLAPLVSGGWQNQTTACVNGTTPTACGTIFPASVFSIQCGDGLTQPVGLGGSKDPPPCAVYAVPTNYRSPYVETWTLNLQQAITSNLALDVAYVGTHGGRLPALIDINQPALGSGFTAAQIAAGDPSVSNKTAEQMARPYFNKGFPYLSNINQLQMIDVSNYNGLQVAISQRVWHGMSFVAGYTFSHALDDFSSTDFLRLPTDSTQPGAVYGNTDFDIRHRFTFEVTYALPGKKSPGKMLEGWSINSIVTLQSGSPWSPKDLNNDISGNGERFNSPYYGGSWNFSGNPADFTSPLSPIPCWSGSGKAPLNGCTILGATAPSQCTAAASHISTNLTLDANTVAAMNSIGCYLTTNGKSVLFPAALGTNGNATRNLFRDSGFKNVDLSITKDWKFRERYDAQFRAEFFNVLNHPNFANPGGLGTGAGFNDPSIGQGGGFGAANQTPDQAGPNPVLGSGGARSMQIGLKLIF